MKLLNYNKKKVPLKKYFYILLSIGFQLIINFEAIYNSSTSS